MKKFSLGLEVIDFQKDDIFDRLVEQFKLLRSKSYKDVDTIKSIESIIKERFGISVNLKYTSKTQFMWLPIPGIPLPLPIPLPASPYVNIDILNPNHVFLTEKDSKLSNKYTKEIIQQIKAFKKQNIVDVKNAKLYGDISEIRQTIMMNKLLKTLLSVEEETAVFLHEVGHIFTYSEQMTKMTSTNLVMLAASNLALSVKTPDEKKIIFKTYVDELELHPDTFNGLEKCKTTQETCLVYILNQSKISKSSTGSSLYDKVSSEQSADQFVSRLHAGRHLVTALDKINTIYFGKRSFIPSAAKDIMVVFSMAELFIILGYFTFHMPFILPIAGYIVYRAFKFFDDSQLSTSYDTIKVRLKRIRQDLLTILKDSQEIDEEKKMIIDKIEQMDKIINKYSDNLTPYMDVMNKIFRIKDYTAYQIQRDLEDLAFNDLFIKAEKLRLT